MNYPYTRSSAFPKLLGGLPLVDIALYHEGHEITVPALVDSGATLSILPYDTGLELGLSWEEQTVPVDVGGVLKGIPAYGVLVRGELSPFPPVALVFAWVHHSSEEIRPILGQMNFFQQYKISFEAYNETFDITPREMR